MEAASNGARVLVLERAAAAGGTTALAGGHFYLGGGTAVQKATGHDDSAEEMERYITIPIETSTSNLKNINTMRSVSLYGLSDIKLQFTFDYTYEEALQQVLNRLAQLPQLPNGAQPQISPMSPIGEVYRYRLAAPRNFSVTDLKTLQDWVLERRFRAVPGVIDVIGWGGKSKTYEVQVDFNKMLAFGVTFAQVLQVLNNSNVTVGGNTINIGPQAAVVRGVGLIKSPDDLANTMLTQNNGNPVLIKDIGTVIVGNQPRLGIAGQDDDNDVVEGIVLMRRGEQSSPTIKRVRAEVERINNGNLLPPGVKVERIYDRQDLIDTTTHTVLHNMVVGIGLVFLLQWLFLGNLRSAVIVGLTIPFALFFAIGILVLRGESANLLSVGAIDFGLIVDATVIMVESIFRRLGEAHEAPVVRHPATPEGFTGKLAAIFQAGTDVNRSILFAACIIIAGFLPLFTLSGVEGHIFGPMAKTYAYALLGGLLAFAPASGALRPALPFVFKGSAEDRRRALRCLTQAVYFEAALEPDSGQAGVAQVVLNRVRDPNYANTVCGVVFEGAERVTGCQFSFTCDGSLARRPEPASWRRARAAAAPVPRARGPRDRRPGGGRRRAGGLAAAGDRHPRPPARPFRARQAPAHRRRAARHRRGRPHARHGLHPRHRAYREDGALHAPDAVLLRHHAPRDRAAGGHVPLEPAAGRGGAARFDRRDHRAAPRRHRLRGPRQARWRCRHGDAVGRRRRGRRAKPGRRPDRPGPGSPAESGSPALRRSSG